MKLHCWRCHEENDAQEATHCGRCEALLMPDEPTRATYKEHALFLLSEIPFWKSVPVQVRSSLDHSYRHRLEQLSRLVEGDIPEDLLVASPAVAPMIAPVIVVQAPAIKNSPPHWTNPTLPPAAELPPPQQQTPHWTNPDPPPTGPAPPPARELTPKELAEQRIRWVYAFAGVLLLSATVGYLRASWDGIGKQLVALLMLASPVAFFAGAYSTRRRLPLSSRMLSIIGGLMLPTGLLAVNVFHLAGLDVPASIWSPPSFLFSALVLAGLTTQLRETACLYLASLCLVLAGATTSSALLLGLTSFGAAGFSVYFGWTMGKREPGPVLEEPQGLESVAPELPEGALAPDFELRQDLFQWLAPHSLRVANFFATVGLLSAFLKAGFAPQSASTLFLIGALYFAGSGFLTGNAKSVLLSSGCGLGGAWAIQNVFNLSGAFVGLFTMLQGTVFLVRSVRLLGERSERDQEVDTLSYWLCAGLTGVVLFATLGWPVLNGLIDNFKAYSHSEIATCAVTGLLGAVFYGAVAWLYRKPNWVYGSAACLTYGYFMTVVLTLHSSPVLYRVLLVLLPLAWQAAVVALRGRIPQSYLTPWIYSATALAALLAPINLLIQMNSPDPYTPWVYAGVALVTVVSAVVQREAGPLYLSLACLTMAYGTAISRALGGGPEPNAGLAFVPLVAVLAVLAQRLRGGTFGAPLWQTALALALVFSGGQAYYELNGCGWTVAAALACYGVGFAVAGREAYPEGCWFWAWMCLTSAVAAVDRFHLIGVEAGLGSCALTMALVPKLSVNRALTVALLGGACLWSASVALFGPSELRWIPSLLWVGNAIWADGLLRSERRGLVFGSTLLLGGAAVTSLGDGLNLAQSVTVMTVGLLQVLVSWQLDGDAEAFSAWLVFNAGLSQLLRHQPPAVIFPTTWVEQVLLGGWLVAARRLRPGSYQTVAAITGLTAALMLAASLFSDNVWALDTLVLYSLGMLALGWQQGLINAFAGGNLVAGLALMKLSMYLDWHGEQLEVCVIALQASQFGVGRLRGTPFRERASAFCLGYGSLLCLWILLMATNTLGKADIGMAFPLLWVEQLVLVGGLVLGANQTSSVKQGLQLAAGLTGVYTFAASFVSNTAWGVATLTIYALALLAAGRVRQLWQVFAAGQVMLAVLLFKLSLWLHWSDMQLTWGVVALELVEITLAAVLAPSEDGATFRYRSSVFAMNFAPVLGAWTWWLAFDFVERVDALPILALGAAVYVARGRLSARPVFAKISLRGPENYVLAFAMLYHAYIIAMSLVHLTSAETYTVPVGLALILWGELFAVRNAALKTPVPTSDGGKECRFLGVLALLAPSLMLSLGADGSHALWAGTLALALLLAGFATNRGAYQAWGGMGLLVEVAIRAFAVAVQLPWQMWLAVAGVALVGVGLIFENRRIQVEAAGRSLYRKFNQW